MQRLPAIDPSTATGETKKALDEVEARLGNSPKVMRTIATIVLNLYANYFNTIAQTDIDIPAGGPRTETETDHA
jgi:t-SNARE complex subunit (syntaxin)